MHLSLGVAYYNGDQQKVNICATHYLKCNYLGRDKQSSISVQYHHDRIQIPIEDRIYLENKNNEYHQ